MQGEELETAEGEEDTEEGNLTLKNIMEAMQSFQAALTSQIETIRLDLSIVKHDVQNVQNI